MKEKTESEEKTWLMLGWVGEAPESLTDLARRGSRMMWRFRRIAGNMSARSIV